MTTANPIAIAIALVAGALLVSCEPIQPYPAPNSPGPYRSAYERDQQIDRYSQPAPRYRDSRDPYDLRDDPAQGRRMEGPPSRETQRQPTRNEYPVAERTSNPNQVLSPYSPYNVIDVEGFRTGQLAKDPSNGKIFRVP